jgi:nitroimidazol reductase NimA-like FMN-containing flavoprotein (pyridoxamine 5'-phosphate oxidase superfamily)
MKITDRAALDGILRSAPILYLALNADPAPYVVPVCFGVEGDRLYVHGAAAGRKIDLIRANPVVGFSACTDVTVRNGDDACSSTVTGASVVGTGRAQIVEDGEERIRGLDAIMRHYRSAGDAPPVYQPKSLARTCVIAIHVATLQGKRKGGAPESPPGSR